MIKIINVDVDFNGIIIFDFPGILTPFGGKIDNGENILQKFTATNKGDLVLDEGIALPIMGIDDGGYVVRVFLNDLPNDNHRQVIFSDKYFYLNVTGDLYVADMAVFEEWEDYTGWHNAEVPKGIYKVCLEGTLLEKEGATSYTYDLILDPINEIGKREIEPRADSRLD